MGTHITVINPYHNEQKKIILTSVHSKVVVEESIVHRLTAKFQTRRSKHAHTTALQHPLSHENNNHTLTDS